MANQSLRAELTDNPVLVALIAGEPMGCPQPFSIRQGEARTVTYTVFKPDGSVLNLVDASLELQVKAVPGGDDPALFDLSTAVSGLTLLDQTIDSDTEGQFTVDYLSAHTSALAGGVYFFDIVLMSTAYPRSYIVPPSPFVVVTVVNDV